MRLKIERPVVWTWSKKVKRFSTATPDLLRGTAGPPLITQIKINE
jgi:hypothetical protein